MRKNAPALALMALAIAMMLIGCAHGEVDTVLARATRICLECVGIG